MKSRIAAIALALAIISSAHASHAGYPAYRVLQAPSGHYGAWSSPGHAQGVSRQSYAWGWFGATRHTQSHYHNGYYGWYRQRTDH